MKLDSVIFYTSNLDEAVAFYQKLGLELEYREDDYASFLLSDNVRLGLKEADEERENPGHQAMILTTTDIKKLFIQMKKGEYKIYSPLEKYDWAETFSILDPDKNKIEFIERTEDIVQIS